MAPSHSHRSRGDQSRPRTTPVAVLAAGLVALIGAATAVFILTRTPSISDNGTYSYERLTDPDRTVLRTADGSPVAVFTDGTRTVVFQGRSRTFAEPDTTTATVTTRSAVRIAPRVWHAGDQNAAWFRAWFTAARASTDPDLLEVSLQYVAGSPNRYDDRHIRYSGPATYGPLLDGTRAEASDFNDYLGISWKYPDGTTRAAKKDHLGSADCSGYVRLVYGYRFGFPLGFGEAASTTEMPRRAIQMATASPGIVIIPDDGRQAAQLHRLQAGDLLFFDSDSADGTQIDHVGIYLGLDSEGRHRFVSSRKTINGPTMGDVGGVSVLDGTGLYSRGFRGARRV